jgi:hypothetical protein
MFVIYVLNGSLASGTGWFAIPWLMTGTALAIAAWLLMRS